jgi:hypothetical protein
MCYLGVPLSHQVSQYFLQKFLLKTTMLFVLTLSTTYYSKYFLLITRVMYFDPLDF